MSRIKHKPTNQQRKWLSYLHYEGKRQADSHDEWTSWPEFMISCCACVLEAKTSEPQWAHDLLSEHIGHKGVSLEVNHFPNAIKYTSREKILERLADFGKYLVKEDVDHVVIKNARLTYKFIKNEGDIEGGLRRLLEVCLGTKDGECYTTDFQRLWLTSIIRNDQKFISRVTERVVSRTKEESKDG